MPTSIKNNWMRFLKWSSQYLHTDISYIAQNGAWLMARRGVLTLTSFFLAVAFANLVPKEIYGTYKYALATIGILSSFTLSGMGTAIIQSVARGFDKTVIDGYRIKFKWDIVASLASLGLGIYYFENGNTAFAFIYWLFAILFPFWDAASHYDDYLQGKTDFKTSARFDIVQQLILFSAMLGAIIFFPQQFRLFVILWLLIQTVFAVVYYQKIKQKIPQNTPSDPHAVNYAKHLSVFNIILTIADRLDSIIAFQLLGPANLAVYSFAIAIPEQIKGVLANLGTIASPRFAKRSLREIKVSLKKKFFFLFLIGCFVVGIYILAAPWIFRIFFPKYRDAIFYSQLFSVSLLNMTFAISGVALEAQKKIKEQYILNITIPVLHTILMLAGTIWLGLLGLIIANIISRFAGSGLGAILLYATKEKQPFTGNNIQSQ